MAMREILGPKGEIHTVSHVARHSPKNEEAWIDIVNKAANAIEHKVNPGPQDFLADLDDFLMEMGEPGGRTSGYAQYRVFREAKRQGLTVMLDGQGADELLGGYAGYMTNFLWELLVQGHWVRMLNVLTSGHLRAKTSIGHQVSRLFYYHLPVPLVHQLGKLLRKEECPRWLNRTRISMETAEIENGYRRRCQVGFKVSLSDSVSSTLVNLLRFEDRNSMRFSIESRVPFLSNRFADRVLSMPANYLIGPQGQSKYVFREAMRGLVPGQILNRKDKIGFENDEVLWLRQAVDWVNRLLAASEGRSSLVNMAVLRAEWLRFNQGEFCSAVSLWNVLLYLRWLELYNATD